MFLTRREKKVAKEEQRGIGGLIVCVSASCEGYIFLLLTLKGTGFIMTA